MYQSIIGTPTIFLPSSEKDGWIQGLEVVRDLETNKPLMDKKGEPMTKKGTMVSVPKKYLNVWFRKIS